MKLRFSQRIGKQPIKVELEKEGLSSELKNSLWTIILELIINHKSNHTNYGEKYSELAQFYRDLWIDFYKWPIDNLPLDYDGSAQNDYISGIVREWYYKTDWYQALDFVEFCSEYHPKFCEICNDFFKREMCAYRFVDGTVVEINSSEEIIEIENALQNSDKFSPVKTHLKTALELLSDRKKPDYRNSIKESISAIESLAKIITKNHKTTLGPALKEIEIKHNIPNSLKSAFSALYGYTSDEGGIRHSLLENSTNVDQEEARFMLIACSAFVNYLISKI